tara:strand:+ start:808 stop:1008 length:201 start_codon:yes stop_codon:yes gene_type:complete
MKFTNRQIRAELKELFDDNTVSDSYYVHAEMFTNKILSSKNPNHKDIQRDVYRRTVGSESGGRWNE